jgi:hypothetical protein
MLSIEQLREVQPNLKNWPDDEVEKLRDNLDVLADIIFDQWLEKRNKEK